jgi:hypothetical protein
MVSCWHAPERLGALAFGLACCALPACSSFDPVSVPHFQFLHAGDNPELGITGAHWIAYDDQHSRTSACTNGATGNHPPSECSTLYEPAFDWAGPKCPNGVNDLSQGEIADPGPNGALCIQGVLRSTSPCARIPDAEIAAGSPQTQCLDTNDSNHRSVDASNMWGAGVGLAFTANDRGWDAEAHGVVGVSFDLSGLTDAKLAEKDFHFRVEIPIELAPELDLPKEQPVMRSDGSVIGTDGELYRYDCSAEQISRSSLSPEQHTGKLQDVVVDGEPTLVTSELHPQGSPFWQSGNESLWVRSPAKAGHNEFKLSSVLAPKDSGYGFDDRRIVGIHFQAAHGDPSNSIDLPFAFCISNLAVLLE